MHIYIYMYIEIHTPVYMLILSVYPSTYTACACHIHASSSSSLSGGEVFSDRMERSAGHSDHGPTDGSGCPAHQAGCLGPSIVGCACGVPEMGLL